MKYHVDLDGTICVVDAACKNTMERYKAARPILERIQRVNALYDEGHTITYWTARGSESGLDLEELTKAQLLQWGCKFHVLLLGKPVYDLYIDDKSHNVDTIWPLTGPAEPLTKKMTTSRVEKGWGYEVIIVNNDLYCGKILHFKTGAKFSMHFHMKKRETWYVTSGRFVFRWINTANADVVEEVLLPGDTITNFVGDPHQIVCEEEGDIFEVSTTHFDSDSYRVGKGDSQGASRIPPST
jgi:mannose-6-phosphate isomerase-like protein (cupin superfamily)